jgi:hypothetical protein
MTSEIKKKIKNVVFGNRYSRYKLHSLSKEKRRKLMMFALKYNIDLSHPKWFKTLSTHFYKDYIISKSPEKEKQNNVDMYKKMIMNDPDLLESLKNV